MNAESKTMETPGIRATRVIYTTFGAPGPNWHAHSGTVEARSHSSERSAAQACADVLMKSRRYCLEQWGATGTWLATPQD